MSRQFFEQCLGLLQISRVEAFGKPAVNLSQQFLGFLLFALPLPQPAQAHRRAQLQ